VEVKNQVGENAAELAAIESAPVHETASGRQTSESATGSTDAQASAPETVEATTSDPEPKAVADATQDPFADAAIGTVAATGANMAANATSSDSFQGVRRPPRQDVVEKETIYVGNLFFDVTQADLMNEFQQFGPIKRAKVITDSKGLSKGYVYPIHDLSLNAIYSVVPSHYSSNRCYDNTDSATSNSPPSPPPPPPSKPNTSNSSKAAESP
jgi:hypothetical protein